MTALILVDLQNDFCPGGALAVKEGDKIIPLINGIQKTFDLVVATQDWHPPNHGSFAANHPGKKPFDEIDLNGIRQTLWPTHCVQNTRGAELVSTLDVSRIKKIFQKGTNPAIDSYSGFFENDRKTATGMGDWLTEQGVKRVHVCGLATDYCVKFTALDARRLGFETSFIENASRGIDPDGVHRALDEMRAAGVKIE